MVRCFYDIVTKPRCTATEKQHIQSALMSNGYSKSYIQRIVKNKRNSTKMFQEYRATTFLLFIDEVSQQPHCRLYSHGNRTVFSSNTTIQNYLVHPIPDTRDRNVYRIPCISCNKVNRGETGGPVGERILEYCRDIRLMRTDNSSIVEHIYDANHSPNWSGVQYIDHDRHWNTRRVKEAIQICLHPNTLSRDRGIDIQESWMSTTCRHTHQTKSSTISFRPTI